MTPIHTINWVDPLGLYSWGEFFGDSSNTIAGFGDYVSFGVSDIIRKQMGINDVVDKCSKAYKFGKYTGIGYSLSTAIVSLFNAGAKTVLYSGEWAIEAALAGKGNGIILAETIGGRILNAIEKMSFRLTGKQLPDIVWKISSGFFAGNAKGTIQVYGSYPRAKSIFLTVKLHVVSFLRNATFIFR